MRLLQVESDGEFHLKEFIGPDIPPYAILSHTWGADHDEVTFRDLAKGTAKKKSGYRKLTFCSQQAANDGLEYFWVDTCCIDKASSAELSEAINSMFRWYHRADKCYVYLSDVSFSESAGNMASSVRKSRWFTRGWTLQELVAPAFVEFFSVEGQRIGGKSSMVDELHSITGIPTQALQGTNPLSHFSVQERMSWLEKRQTKREEDLAYCLLGVFNVTMPLIYGEGRERAFRRLQKEIQDSLEYEPASALPPTERSADPREATPPTGPGTQGPEATEQLQSHNLAEQHPAAKGYLDVVKLLLDNSADLTSRDSVGRTPLYLAAWNGQIELVALFLHKGANIDTPNRYNWTPLRAAASKGYLEVVRLLLSRGADPTIPHNDGGTPLHAAAWQGHTPVVELLLDKGVDATVPDIAGRTPLYAAAWNGQADTVELLIRKGRNVDINTPNQYQWTPLRAAATKGFVDVVKVLLEHGADVSIPHNLGGTPLHAAAWSGHVEVARLLLEKGADHTVANNSGWTPVAVATSRSHWDVVGLLLKYGAELSRTAH